MISLLFGRRPELDAFCRNYIAGLLRNLGRGGHLAATSGRLRASTAPGTARCWLRGCRSNRPRWPPSSVNRSWPATAAGTSTVTSILSGAARLMPKAVCPRASRSGRRSISRRSFRSLHRPGFTHPSRAPSSNSARSTGWRASNRRSSAPMRGRRPGSESARLFMRPRSRGIPACGTFRSCRVTATRISGR